MLWWSGKIISFALKAPLFYILHKLSFDIECEWKELLHKFNPNERKMHLVYWTLLNILGSQITVRDSFIQLPISTLSWANMEQNANNNPPDPPYSCSVEGLGIDTTAALLVCSQLPGGSIREDWHGVSITLTYSSLRPSLILFSCWVVSLAYCSLSCFTFQWGLPCCTFRCILSEESYSFLMKGFDMHMKAWVENEAGLLWVCIPATLKRCGCKHKETHLYPVNTVLHVIHLAIVGYVQVRHTISLTILWWD